MSVRTTADENREEAKEHLKKAYDCLISVLNTETWGNDQYTDEYIDKIHKTSLQLLHIKREL